MSNKSTPFVSSTGESRNPIYEGQFDGETPEQAIARLHWARAATELAGVRINAARGEAVAWEYRTFHDDNTVTPGWGAWERVQASARYAGETAASRAREIQDYIDRGYRYELRALYTAPPATDGAVTPRAHSDVLAERRRQVEKEGWTPEHDDEHDGGDLAAAASAYALYAADELNPHSQGDGDYGRAPPVMWPFNRTWWKPEDERSSLVKAGALVLAEIERIDRAAAQVQP